MDLRRRVMADVDKGMYIEAVAEKYSVSTRVIFQWRDLREETGELFPRKGKTGPKRKLDSHRLQILSAVQENPSTTLEELKAKLELPGCLQTVWNALRQWGIVLKKVMRAAEQQRADVQSKRRWWEILVSRQPIGGLVFLDEAGANTKMIRRYRWGPRSARIIDDVPHGHWKTTTFVPALRSSGFTAPLVVDGPMNGNVFLAYVEQ